MLCCCFPSLFGSCSICSLFQWFPPVLLSCGNKKRIWDAWEKTLPSNPPFHNVWGPTTCAQISCTPLLLYSTQKSAGGLFWLESLHMGIKYDYKCSVAICEVLSQCQHIPVPMAILVRASSQWKKKSIFVIFCKMLVSKAGSSKIWESMIFKMQSPT